MEEVVALYTLLVRQKVLSDVVSEKEEERKPKRRRAEEIRRLQRLSIAFLNMQDQRNV